MAHCSELAPVVAGLLPILALGVATENVLMRGFGHVANGIATVVKMQMNMQAAGSMFAHFLACNQTPTTKTMHVAAPKACINFSILSNGMVFLYGMAFACFMHHVCTDDCVCS